MAVRYYGDVGLRPMADVDVLVTAPDLPRAVAVLQRLGWSPKEALTPAYVLTRHAMSFVGAGGHQCDLHWRFFEESLQPYGLVAVADDDPVRLLGDEGGSGHPARARDIPVQIAAGDEGDVGQSELQGYGAGRCGRSAAKFSTSYGIPRRPVEAGSIVYTTPRRPS